MINRLHFKHHMMILLLFATLLVAIQVQISRFDSSELSRISAIIDTIARLDVESEQEMMAIFTHTAHPQQRLQHLTHAFRQQESRLHHALKDELDEIDEKILDRGTSAAGDLTQQLTDLYGSITTQISAIKAFSTDMARLSQARQRFPELVAQTIKQHPDEAQRITTLASNMSQWQLFSDPKRKQQLENTLAQLDTENRKELSKTGRAILHYRTRVKQDMKTAENCRITENLAQVRANFEHHYTNEVHLHSISKRILTAMVAVLLLYLLLLLLSTHRKNLSLKQILAEKEKLQEHNRLLLAAMQRAPDGILVCNCDGIILYANQHLANMHGTQDPNNLVGRYAAELRGGQPHDNLYHAMVEATNRGEQWCGEYTLQLDGKPPVVVSRTMSGIDLDGHHYLVGIDRDVTQERERSAKLEAAQHLESLGVLSGGIAHDFNNILTAIRGNAALAKRNSGDEAKPYLQHIEAATQRAADLCQQMLAYAGKGQFVIEPLHLSTLVHDVSQLIAVSIDKRITLNLDLATDIPAIEGDRTQLQQVVLNLITNASEAISGQEQVNDGTITITTRERTIDQQTIRRALCGEEIKPGPFVVLEVCDNGCGMDEATIQRIFEPFFTTKFTGRGLGMSAILGIVNNHHGALLLESTPGEGSCFSLLLPPTGKPLPQTDHTTTDPQESPSSGMVLIIDDEAVIREMAAEILADAGLQTITAEDGEQGVARFRQHQSEIDAVLLDMTMPKMDGEQCFKALRAIRADLPVVVASGYGERDVVAAFGEGTLAGFLQKPFDPDHLQQTMQKIVIAHRQL